MGDNELNVFTEDEKPIVYLLTAVSLLSLFGSLFIIITYICFRKIRNYAYKLVTYLSYSDIILSIGNILSWGTIKYKAEDHLCFTQAFLINFGGLASVLWTSVIAWSIYSATVLNAKNLRDKNMRFLLVGYGVSLALSIIPFITKQYGRAGLYCWIEDQEIVKDSLMRFAMFYIPLWIALSFNIYAYLRVIAFIKKYISTTLEVRFVHRLKYYPMVLVICWTFPTINRIYNIFGEEVKALTYLHVIFGGLQGFLNALVYGANDQVRQAWREKLDFCSRISFYSKEDDTNGQLKRNEEMQQNRDQEDHNDEIQGQSGDANNASIEVVRANEVSERNKKPKGLPKLAVRI